MPRFKTGNDDAEPVERYRWHAQYVTPVNDIGQVLRDWRRRVVRDREEFLGFQKAYGRNDPEYARFFKGRANRCMRLIRAITLAIPWFDIPDSKQEAERPLLWPLDLEAELDEVARYLCLTYG